MFLAFLVIDPPALSYRRLILNDLISSERSSFLSRPECDGKHKINAGLPYEACTTFWHSLDVVWTPPCASRTPRASDNLVGVPLLPSAHYFWRLRRI